MIVDSLASSTPISLLLVVEGGENSMTTPGDYWMTADTEPEDGFTTRPDICVQSDLTAMTRDLATTRESK
jgi:hypothetical protein